MSCKRCGSWAINHGHHGRDGSDPKLCDVCYWRKRAEAKDAELAGYVEANKHMKGELDDALEDARKYCEAKREIARLRDALTHIAEYWNRSENDTAMNDALFHMIETAEDALAQAADVPK